MKGKPNIDTFLAGGAENERSPKGSAAGSSRASGNDTTDFRKQMVMQLPVSLINELKKRALELSLQTGKRVTQQQLVEEALKDYLHR